MSTRARRLAPALAIAFAVAVPSGLAPSVAAAKVRTGPAGVAFYTPPSPLPGRAHGDLIWARPLTGRTVIPTQDPSHLKIATPVLIEQGTSDGIVLPAYTDALARELRAAGATVTYKKYPGVGHEGVQLQREPTNDAYRFVKARLGRR